MSEQPVSNQSDEQSPAPIPKPRPYHLTDVFQERGLWCFWLTADDDVLEYVSNLHCILQTSAGFPFQRKMHGRVLFAINPRYDQGEVWRWIREMLDCEAAPVELNDAWESAIQKACIDIGTE